MELYHWTSDILSHVAMIKSYKNAPIRCSAISSDANWIAYSTDSVVRLLRFCLVRKIIVFVLLKTLIWNSSLNKCNYFRSQIILNLKSNELADYPPNLNQLQYASASHQIVNTWLQLVKMELYMLQNLVLMKAYAYCIN